MGVETERIVTVGAFHGRAKAVLGFPSELGIAQNGAVDGLALGGPLLLCLGLKFKDVHT
jgi:hypothetical protein